MGARDSSIDCLFRHDVLVIEGEETARCALVDTIATRACSSASKHNTVLASAASRSPRVLKAACLACEHRDNRTVLNKKPVFASLLYEALESMDGDSLDRASCGNLSVHEWTVKTLCGHSLQPKIHATSGCDVFVRCRADSESLNEMLNAILAQHHVFVTLYLAGDVPLEWRDRAEHDARVIVANCSHSKGDRDNSGSAANGDDSLWETACRSLPRLRSEFVALFDDVVAVTPGQLATALQRLGESGAEAVDIHRLNAEPRSPAEGDPVGTLVVRRATVADLRAEPIGSSADFLRIARRQRRPVAAEIAPKFEDNASRFVQIRREDGDRARAEVERPRCDVVLPFHNQLDYVEEALRALLAQRDADVVVHLVDDCSTEPTDAFLRRWAEHSEIRVYRNRENIGQFSSFNNVSRYFETDYAAVQDADDISMPHRIGWSIESMKLADADFFAGAVQLFGNMKTIVPEQPECETFAEIEIPQFRRSYYPPLGRVRYFAENPTLVMKVDAFRGLGGFADFGDPLSNRASVDTEFQCRALLSGRRFAISQCVVLRYRVHGESATQNTETGWKSEARNKSQRLADEFRTMQEQGPFDPRVFGALGRYEGVTERWRPSG